MNEEQIATLVFAEIATVAAETGQPVKGGVDRDTLVFESGLDSLGFAILVAKLEDLLGFDPFAALAEPVYPTTVGEFIVVYARHALAPA